ncbi:hypothetical protein AKJ51_00995 [candidate division MSBL1 archaeon SCGC-AAA382A20]|uniref:NodB homology domain-containing protein n=1 Tax=candidate division MSBL1 archaeon SCGC-AAA382A20 TaxID=1698280 RepID=A0A133VM77_9EURY|nr:hypothetical protein AKJ51_00995 [candidate division MSBL1 archaeon SCGC-AAA382A20]
MNKKNQKKLYVTITMDVDPDANIAVEGSITPVSPEMDRRISIRETRWGLYILFRIADILDLPLTVFWEARTLNLVNLTWPELINAYRQKKNCEHGCHGYRHEDYDGKKSGQKLSFEETKALIGKASNIISRTFGCRPAGFRAPYCRLTDNLIKALGTFSFQYDASITVKQDKSPPKPYQIGEESEGQIREIPLYQGRDSKGEPVSGYLWQLFEGNRTPDQYLSLVQGTARKFPGCMLQIAIHPWHLRANKKNQSPARIGKAGVSKLWYFLKKLQKIPNVELVTVSEYLGL